jgi:MFS family permease
MVVFLQYWLTKKFEDFPAMLMMAVGTAIMGVGLPIYALGSSYLFFVSGIVVITIGELIVVPVAQTIAINFSPGDMRGRYAASYSLTWSIANATGPILGGFVMDEFNPHLVWYLAGGVAIVAATGYLRLYLVQTKEQVAEQNPARSILGSHR